MPGTNRVRRRCGAIALLAAAALAGAAFAGGPDDETAIRGLLAAQAAAWNRGDAPGWTAGFTADADFVNILGMHFSGSAAIAERHDQLFRTVFQGSHLEVTVAKVRFLSASSAVVETVHRLAGYRGLPPGIVATDPSGELRTRLKYVLVRDGERWTIVSAQNTAIRPEAR